MPPPRRTVDHTGIMAIRDLAQLLANLSVRQRPGRWCFVSGAAIPVGMIVAATVVEDEGTTAVITVDDAEDLGIEPGFVAAWLTLEVTSALDAIGLTAAVATALADAGISCNVLAGYHHDHLLVPEIRSAEAIAAIAALRAQATPSEGIGPNR